MILYHQNKMGLKKSEVIDTKRYYPIFDSCKAKNGCKASKINACSRFLFHSDMCYCAIFPTLWTGIFLSPVLQAVVKLTWPVPLAWRLVNSISIPGMSAFLICLLIWRQHGQMVTKKKSWRSMPIQLF